jgi:LysR family transcriptional activator of glutamate synthase operon
MMELDQLRSFLAVAQVRSFTRAAALVHLSQPAISRQIARLEKELGVPLFERYGRRVETTTDGKMLLPLAKTIVARADDAARLIKEHAGVASSRVSLGSTGTVFAYVLSPLLALFIKKHPRVHLDLVELEDALLEDAVLNGQLDCAVITAWGSTRAAVVHLLTEEIMLIVPASHRLAGRSCVSLKELADEPLLFPGHSLNISNLLMDACRQAGFEPKVPYRANYPELSKALMRLGLGLALLPQTFLTPGALQGLVAIPLEEHLTRDLNLIYSREHPLSTAARTLVSDLREGVNHTSVQAAAQVAAGVGRVDDARATDRKGVTLGL